MRLRQPFSPVKSTIHRLLERYVMATGLEHSRDAKNLASTLSVLRAMDGWITLRQAMAYLCTSHVPLGKLIKAGHIRAFKPDYGTHAVLVSLDDVRTVLADSARRAGVLDGCVNQSLPQPDNEEKSKPKSKRRGKQI